MIFREKQNIFKYPEYKTDFDIFRIINARIGGS